MRILQFDAHAKLESCPRFPATCFTEFEKAKRNLKQLKIFKEFLVVLSLLLLVGIVHSHWSVVLANSDAGLFRRQLLKNNLILKRLNIVKMSFRITKWHFSPQKSHFPLLLVPVFPWELSVCYGSRGQRKAWCRRASHKALKEHIYTFYKEIKMWIHLTHDSSISVWPLAHSLPVAEGHNNIEGNYFSLHPMAWLNRVYLG